MTKKTLKNIIEREFTNFEKIRQKFKSDYNFRVLSLGFFLGNALLASTLIYGPKLIDKIETTQYVKNKRREYKERKEFIDKVENAMEDPENITLIDPNKNILYVDIDDDKKPDAIYYCIPGFRIYDIGVNKIKR